MNTTGHIRLEGRSWRLYYRVAPAPGQPRRQRSVRLGSVRELPNRSAARRAADRVLEQLAPRALHAGHVVPWPEWCRLYEARHLTLLARSSRATRQSILRKHLITVPAIANLAVHQIGADVIQELVLAWHAAGAAPSTVKARFSLLHCMLTAAAAAGLAATPPPASRIRLPRDQSAPVAVRARAFSGEQCAALIEAATGPLKVAIALARYAGLRAGEICGLQWDCIELEHGRLEVRQQAQDGKLVPPKTQSAAATLAVPAPLVELLRAYRVTWTPNPAGLLFADAAGRPLDTDVLRRELHRLLDALGIARMGFHALRHACAIAMSQACPNVEAMRRALRHRSIRSTAIYLAAAPEDVAAALAAGARS